MISIEDPVLALSERRAYADRPRGKGTKAKMKQSMDEDEYLDGMQKEISNFAEKDVMDILNKKNLSLD